MLRVQINKNEFVSDIVPIDYTDYTVEEMSVEDDGVVVHSVYSDKCLFDCRYNYSEPIRVGDTIVCTYTMPDSDGNDVSSVQEYKVSGTDDVLHSFSCVVDEYVDLNANTFSYVKVNDYDESGDTYTSNYYIYLYLDRFHFWGDDVYPIGVSVYWQDENGASFELVGEPFGNECIRFPLMERDAVDCTNADDAELCSIMADDVEWYNRRVRNNIIMAMALFRHYGLIDSDETVWENILSELFTDDMLSNEYSAEPYQFMQYNFMFSDPSNLRIGLRKPRVSLSIPLTSRFSTDLYSDLNVSEKFVEVEMKKAVNTYTEMEKDVYTPVFIGDGYESPVTEIRFNLHFREREGSDWKIIRDKWWNGVRRYDNTAKFMGRSNSSSYGYFSYNNKSLQPDLLGYLGFSDSDVKYRKNTLKKSFLRLSFFDSTQPTRQNMLCYSTVFIDAGKLFSKYMRNFENPKTPSDSFAYSRMVDGGANMKKELSGIRVNREPYWNSYPQNLDDIEELRLSSQFVVRDKYSSDSSSEGFYLYLWKGYGDGNAPSDIYMKVEFNHAGFGRTIPFMMPYDASSHSIKKFETILEDFTKRGGYNVNEYLKYSYIHFKYAKNEDGKHVYYLDPNQYGYNSISFNDGVLSLNLYEAKLKDESN